MYDVFLSKYLHQTRVQMFKKMFVRGWVFDIFYGILLHITRDKNITHAVIPFRYIILMTILRDAHRSPFQKKKLVILCSLIYYIDII